MQTGMARGDPDRFARRLADLKEAGSSLLVVGDHDRARSAVSTQLLGAAEADRTPIFVLLGSDRSIIDARVPDHDLDDSQFVEYDFYRSATQSSHATTPTRRLESLDNLLEEIVLATESVVDRTDDPPDPGDIRVCIDALTPVIDGFDQRAVENFTADLRTIMKAHESMAHSLLPLHQIPDRYSWLKRGFDAIVETRSVDGVAEERWRLPKDDLCTEWFRVDAVGIK